MTCANPEEHPWRVGRDVIYCVVCGASRRRYATRPKPVPTRSGTERAPTPVPTTLARAAARDGAHCRYCGTHDNLTAEHLTPRCRGGSNALDNIGISCKSCNNEKGRLTDVEYRIVLAYRVYQYPP